MKKILALFTLIIVLVSCSKEPEKINFGSDMCHFCKMTIVDTQHAAQYVTKKGKQYKYDAIECVLNEFSETGADHTELILVSDYSNPGVMVDARTATYLVSKEIKSPMGAYLTGFSQENDAKAYVKSDEDRIYTWQTIKQKFAVK